MPTPWPNQVHPILIECVEIICAEFEKATIGKAYAKPYFGYRSEEEQNALYAQGRTPIYEVNMLRQRVGLQPLTDRENERTVTNAKGGQSKHNALPARAVDLVIVRRDKGTLVWDSGIDLDKDGEKDYIELGKAGEEVGLIWGGRWKNPVDWGHFELPNENTAGMSRLYEVFSNQPEDYGKGNAAYMVSHYDLHEEVERERAKYAYIYP